MTVHKNRHGAAAVAVAALGASLLTAVPADAASVQLKGGSTRLTASQNFSKQLAKRHVKLRAARPATRSGRRVTLPITSGSVDATKPSGRANHSGYISFVRGSRKGSVSGITLRLGRQAVLTARIRGQRMTFLYLNSRATSFGQSGFNLTLSNVTGRLSSKAAKAMNRSLRTTAFHRGQSMTLSLTGSPSSVAIGSGSAAIPIDPGFVQALAGQGAQLVATPPASLSNNTLTLPITGGSLPTVPNLTAGLVNFGGGLAITVGSVTLPLSSIALDLGSRALNVSGPFTFPFASVAGTLAPTINALNHTFDFSGISAGLTQQASAVLAQNGINIAPNTVITSAATLHAIAQSLIGH